MAWDKTKPANDGIRKNAPAEIRANWDAIELGTDSALQITNAKVAAGAAIADTKLAQITTAGKVSGAAITSLPSVPSGAGALPIANVPSIPGSKLTTLGTISSGAGAIPDANMPATLVKLTGDQTVAGVKTFSSIPVGPSADPTADDQLARKAYVDSKQGRFESQLLHVRDEKPANTGGGTFTSGSWITRTLNTVKTNEIASASVASNQITLPAGTYFIQARVPAYASGTVKAKLRNVTDGADVIIGDQKYSGLTGGGTGYESQDNTILGRFTLSGTKVLEIQHRCDHDYSDIGLGAPANFGVIEVYTEVLIWKVS